MHRTARVLVACLALVACGSSEREAGPGAAAPSPPASSPGVPSATPPAPSSSAAGSPTAVEPAAVGGCPPRYLPRADGPWAPAVPTTETPGRLVPDADPVEALVCRYAALAGGATPLVGARAVTGGLDRVRTELHRLPPVPARSLTCSAAGAPLVPHLLRLRYADGELWLSAVHGAACAGTTNGATSSAGLGERLAAAYDTATWPPSSTPAR